MIAAVSLLEAWGLVVSSILTAAAVLTALAKVPGFRWVFNNLVMRPFARVIDERVMHGIGLQAEMVHLEVQRQLGPIRQSIDDINQAVNNVAPGVDPIKTKVHALQEGQAVIETKVDTLTEFVKLALEKD